MRGKEAKQKSIEYFTPCSNQRILIVFPLFNYVILIPIKLQLLLAVTFLFYLETLQQQECYIK